MKLHAPKRAIETKDLIYAMVQKSLKKAGYDPGNPNLDWVPPIDNRRMETREQAFSYARLCKSLLTMNMDDAKNEYAVIRKALGDVTAAAGGVLVPIEQDKDIIEPLRANSIAMQLGVPRRQMTSSTLTLPRHTATAATWGYSNEQRSESTNQTFEDVTLIAKDLWVMIHVARNLIRDADPAVDALVKEDGSKELALALDKAFFIGSGVAPEPLGLINYSGINEPDSGGIAAASIDYLHAKRLVASVMNDNGNFTGWATSPQVWHELTKLKDGEGRFIVNQGDPQKGIMPTLLGFPVGLSTQLKNSAGTTHYLIGGDFKGQAMIGERQSVEIRVSEHFRFDRNQATIMLDARYDTAIKQDAAFAKLDVTSVTEL